MTATSRTNCRIARRNRIGAGAPVHARKSLALLRAPRAASPWSGLTPVNS